MLSGDLPETFTRLTKLNQLDLSKNNLTRLSPILFQLPDLYLLTLSDNKISEIGDDVGKLTSLLYLYLGNNNEIRQIPSSIGNLRDLRGLYLPNNQVPTLPTTLTKLTNLTYLNLENNNFTEIPEWLVRLPMLNQLRMDGNPIRQMPPSRRLFHMLDNGRLKDELGDKLKAIDKIVLTRQDRLQNRPIPWRGSNTGLTETTEWMEICKYLATNFRLEELREIARDLQIQDVSNKSKRQLCSELAKQYEEFHGTETKEPVADRKCTNEPLFGEYDSYDFYNDNEVVEFTQGRVKFCFTLDELTGIYGEAQPLNPYNRQP
jgi:hypothetical protein